MFLLLVIRCDNVICISQVFSPERGVTQTGHTNTNTSTLLLSIQCQEIIERPTVDIALEEKSDQALLELYDEHLNNTSPLGDSSIQFSVRVLRDMLKYSFRGQNEEAANGASLITLFSTLGAQDSYLNRRGGTLRHVQK